MNRGAEQIGEAVAPASCRLSVRRPA